MIIYYVSCLLFALFITLNAANCLSSPQTNDKVLVVKSPTTTNPVSHDKVKESFNQIFDKLTIQVKENTPIGSKLTDIYAAQSDHKLPNEHHQNIIYAIVGGADQQAFELHVDAGESKVELRNNVNFDYESSKTSYSIIIRATSLFLRYEVEVDILVIDENDNRPQLEDFSIVFNNYKNAMPTGSIGKVPASDPDITDQLTYRIVSGNSAEWILVDETTGDIQLSPWLNGSVPLKHLLEIAVSDGVNDKVATLSLNVNLITDLMLRDSVVLVLNDTTREEFLTEKYEIFLNAMKSKLEINAQSDIVVYDVEESVQTSQSNDTQISSVSLSFSVRKNIGDLESYMDKQYLEELISINKASLEQLLGDKNITLSINNQCALEPCLSYQECKTIYQFDKVLKPFIATRNMLFRAIKTRPSYSCSCRPVTSTNSSDCLCDCGECDKKTHYQPAENVCLPCDCYNIGSLGTSCNYTTGQCKCRPGVVGRRCDSCASSYAEVTLRGCDVIYDACPKTYSEGIWWDKTSLDKWAKQQCPPSTSTGTASRFCHQTEGWQKADTFDCISNTFLDLHRYYNFFENNKITEIKPYQASELASNLRFALNQTISNQSMQLYGSDMFLSFRLIHYLIQHEVRQVGRLNLTHRQDRLFIRNIVESINYILSPEYADNWSIIAKRSPDGGAEHLLSLMDSYGKFLIESQSDVFTQPFEIATKYFIFGMEQLSNGRDSGKTQTARDQVSYPPYARDVTNVANLTSFVLAGMNEVQPHIQQDDSLFYPDYTVSRDSPAIVVPKYDIYAHIGSNQDEATKAVIPLKIVRNKSPQEFVPLSYYESKRDDLVRPEVVDKSYKPHQAALVVYSVFKTLGPLLPDHHDNTVQHRFGMMAVANSPVVWLTIRGANSSEFLNKNIQPKINYALKMIEPAGKTRPQCAVWNFIPLPLSTTSKNQTMNSFKQTGRFTTRGCEMKAFHPNHKLRYKYDYVNCSCDQLGAVTVLMDNYAFVFEEDSNVKDTSLLVGLIASLIILILNLFILTNVRGHTIKSNSNSINKNILFILIVLELLVVYNVMSRNSLNQREYQCKIVAIFLHYFSISLFFWLLVNAIHFYRMLTELKDVNHGPMKFYHVLGYAIPAFFVSIAVGLRIENFGNYLFCWLSVHEPIIWSMFGPISVVFGITVILFLLTFFSRQGKLDEIENPNNSEFFKVHLLINLIKTPLIGIYWLIVVYLVNEALLDYVYLFPFLAIMKSLAIFFLFCIVDKHIRYNLYVSWLRFKGEKIGLDDSLNYVSNEWMPPMIGDNAEINKHYQQYAGYTGQVTTPGFQNSSTDIFRPDMLAFSDGSTTSRSSVTETSSSAYQHRVKDSRESGYGRTGGGRRHRRCHKKSHRHHKHHHHHHHRHHHHPKSQKSHHQQDEYSYEHSKSRRCFNDSQQQLTLERSSDNNLASSHSSDAEVVSNPPKKAPLMDPIITEDSNIVEENAQTVPMELSAPTEIGAEFSQSNSQNTKQED